MGCFGTRFGQQPRMVLSMRKIIYSVLALLALGLLFAHVSLSMMSLEKLIVCAATDDASRVPSPVCMYYLENLTNREDADQLDAGAGLAYAFDVPDNRTRRMMMERLLEIGVDINAPSDTDGLTPLNSAILLNDPGLVEFLIRHGADMEAKDSANRLNARQYLDFLQRRDGATDRSQISALLDRGGSQT